MIKAAAVKLSRRLALKRAALRSWWLGVRVRWFWASPWGGRLQKQQEAIEELGAQIEYLQQGKLAAEGGRAWEQHRRLEVEDKLNRVRAQREKENDLLPILAALLDWSGGQYEITEQSLAELSHDARVEVQHDPIKRSVRLILIREARRPGDRGTASPSLTHRSGYVQPIPIPQEYMGPFQGSKPGARWDYPNPEPLTPAAMDACWDASKARRAGPLAAALASGQAKVAEAVDRALKVEIEKLAEDVRRSRL